MAQHGGQGLAALSRNSRGSDTGDIWNSRRVSAAKWPSSAQATANCPLSIYNQAVFSFSMFPSVLHVSFLQALSLPTVRFLSFFCVFVFFGVFIFPFYFSPSILSLNSFFFFRCLDFTTLSTSFNIHHSQTQRTCTALDTKRSSVYQLLTQTQPWDDQEYVFRAFSLARPFHTSEPSILTPFPAHHPHSPR